MTGKETRCPTGFLMLPRRGFTGSARSGQGIGLLSFFFIVVGLLPFVPHIDALTSVLFVALLLAIASREAFSARFPFVLNSTALRILLLLFYLGTLNSAVAAFNDVSPAAHWRGLIPFLFLAFYCLLCPRKTFGRLLDGQDLLSLIMLASCSWALFLIARNLNEVNAVIQGQLLRLTYVERDLLIPFGMLGFILALYGIGPLRRARWILVFIFLFLVIVAGYRAQIMILLAVILFRFRHLSRKSSLIGFASVCCLVGFMALLNQEVLRALLARLSFLEGDHVRSAERAYALRHFWEAPLFGKGLGFPVPIELTRTPAAALRFSVDHVSYIHNLPAYILMTSGLAGLALFTAILFPPLLKMRFILAGRASLTLEAAMVCYLSLLVFFLVSASFRQIQMLVVLACLLRVIEIEGRRSGSLP